MKSKCVILVKARYRLYGKGSWSSSRLTIPNPRPPDTVLKSTDWTAFIYETFAYERLIGVLMNYLERPSEDATRSLAGAVQLDTPIP